MIYQKIPPPINTKGTNIRIEWIDVARTITMVLVIFGHCTYYKIDTAYGGIDYIFDNEDSLCPGYRILNYIVSFIYTFHMPFFMAISGACYSFVHKKYNNIIELVKDKWIRLIVPFFVVTTFISIPIKYLSGYYDGSDDVLMQIVCGQYLLLGNSHLWFLASLFWVFLLFSALQRIAKYNWLYWIVLLSFYFIGDRIRENFIGIPGCLKHLISFAIGFYCIEYFKRIQVRNIIMLASWTFMFAGFMVFRGFVLRLDNTTINSVILLMLALWGCINMVMSSKLLTSIVLGNRLYKYFSKNSYELYLYSDPFNYVIIGILFTSFGSDVYLSNQISVLAFIIRFFVTILISILIIKVHNIVKYNK